jgi:hypothetical protein
MSFSKKNKLKTLLIGRDFMKQQLRAVAFRNLCKRGSHRRQYRRLPTLDRAFLTIWSC